MNRETVPSTREFGLLANGTSARWDVAIDESHDGGEMSLEIESPQIYLVIRLLDLTVISKAVRVLESALNAESVKRGGKEDEDVVALGRFGSASVSLIRDDEGFPRCFIVIAPKARNTLRVSLEATDIQMLREALQGALKDLPQATELNPTG